MKTANIFNNPLMYELFQSNIGRSGTREIIRNEILKPEGVNNVLDFGCGIGYHSKEFPNAEYLGIEPLIACVEKAKKMFKKSNREFIVGDHNSLKNYSKSSFDLILAIGVAHHVDDQIFAEFVHESFRLLKPGGRLTTFDPVFHENQTRLSKWIVSRDRGSWVRTKENYLKPILETYKFSPSVKIYSKLLRIPYDHIFIEVIKD
jgi:SAM-dependent methyltransferase